MSDLLYRKNRKYYLLLTVPSLCVYLFSVVGPLLLGTIPSSLYDWNVIKGNRDFIGFANFGSLLADKSFLGSLGFTVMLALFTIIGTNLLALTIAVALQERIWARGLVRSMFFVPNIMSSIMISFVWIFIFTGAIPSLGRLVGLPMLEEISWFGTKGMATFTIILVSIWQGTGFLMMLYIAGLQTIPTDVLEAALLDGCTGVRKVVSIQLPLLMPTITINLFVSIANAFKAFDIPYALTGGGPSQSTQTVALNIYNDAFSSYRMGYGSAKSVVLFLIVALVTVVQLAITRKREVQS